MTPPYANSFDPIPKSRNEPQTATVAWSFRLKAGDLSVVSALAINTSRSAIVCTECVHRVAEYVEGVYAELRVQLLRDLEFLYRRHVRIET
jgi:hypothetical protein